MQQNNEYVVTILLTFHVVVLILLGLAVRCSCVDEYFDLCVPRSCDAGPNISYPFRIVTEANGYCGYPGFELNCSSSGYPVIQLYGEDYVVDDIFYENNTVRLHNAAFDGPKRGCFPQIKNYSSVSPLVTIEDRAYSYLQFFSDCDTTSGLERYKVGCSSNGDTGLVMFSGDEDIDKALEDCTTNVIALVEDEGFDEKNVKEEYEDIMKRGLELSWAVSDCSECNASGGRCGFNATSRHFKCFCTDRPHSSSCKPGKSKNMALILGTVIGGIVFILIICGIISIIWCRKKRNKDSTFHMSRNVSNYSKSKADIEVGSVRYGVPVYTYAELEKATASFDSANELGDGGFGIVYFGKLKDGREVAVKRLYEDNYKRMEHFINEINILTTLRHPNLVSLYGCTSRRSRELLLVYEYVPNGRVADHITGRKARERALTWPVRMNIALETANALAYLHKSEIIHRDVKTNNILLDQNFSVKVADFGLSRHFPLDVSHVSTAPQGTPGYVDPEYHQCYQLTVKSDVYSFGVVLVELISSLPAVDINRHRQEINLSNLAINRIQRNALDELVDSSLGYGSDPEVTRMTRGIAELAYRCLHVEKEMRPSMDEVVEILESIKEGTDNSEPKEVTQVNHKFGLQEVVGVPPSPESDEIVLLKSMKFPPSPISVTQVWVSGSSSASV